MNAPYSSKALPAGAMIREWRLEEVLGVGGFGIVYRGRGAYFDELVAIKEYFPSAISDRIDETVKPTDSSSEEIYDLGLKKFVEEAKILWQLSQPQRHPNIVSVRSLFEIHGTAYMVMDFEEGVSLSQMLRQGRRFDEATLMALLRPIAEGLDRAHRAGVIHRDIKPPNILVDETGRPVLIDFGSARFDSGQATSTKVTFYTPPYAALEQYVKTYPQGPWTDIYALGVVAYQCVTGEKPAEVLERLHGEADQPLSARDWPGFSRTFTKAVDAAMGIRPSERPQSISEWLKLFDGAEPEPEAEPDDDATRIVVRPPPPEARAEPPPSEVVPAPPAAVEPSAVEAATPAPEGPAAPRNRLAIAGGVAALAVAAIAGVTLMLPKHPAATPPAPAAPAGTLPIAVAAPSAASQSQTGPQQVEQGAQALLAAAQRAARPQAEVAALAAANGRIGALASQLRSAGASPQAATLTQQLNGEARAMAAHEAAAVDRAAQSQAREVERSLGKSVKTLPADAGRALSALRKSRSDLSAAASQVSKAADGAAALAGASAALDAYGTFSQAYAAAGAFALPAKRAEFAAMASGLHGLGDRVAAFAGKPKPGLFAGHARKQAYETLVGNAQRAKAQLAQLDELTAAVQAATDAKQVEATARRTDPIKQALNELYASSSAAAQQLQ